MINKKNIVTVFLLFSFLGLFAQEPPISQGVNVHFFNTPLGEILDFLSEQHDIQFSYSNNRLKLQKKVTFHSEGKTLQATLNQFFEENNIAYANIGNQLVLKPVKRQEQMRKKRRKRQKERKERKQKTLERGTLFDFDFHNEISTFVKEKEVVRPPKPTKQIAPIQVRSIGNGIEGYHQDIKIEPVDTFYFRRKLKNRIGQLSIFPFISTNRLNLNKANILSFNIFWGLNGGLNGIEVGGIVNAIRRHMHGVQLAGFFNHVQGHAYGLQWAGIANATNKDFIGGQLSGVLNLNQNTYGTQWTLLFNVTKDLYGFQVVGLTNIATNVHGLQVAGMLNFANGKLAGVQVAGLGNLAWGGNSAIQFAGGFNRSAKAQFQIAGVYNEAQVVEGAQIGGINIANQVKGLQVGAINHTDTLEGVQIGLLNSANNAKGVTIGIVNVLDSIHGLPFGLINIVKNNGYNRFELGGADALYLKIEGKFGAPRLYHIVHLGWRPSSVGLHSWSAGLGLGTVIPINKQFHLNAELLISHVNEEQFFSKHWNLLNQFRFTWDIRLSDQSSFFLGPTFNLMYSDRYHAETNTYGSQLMPYTLFDQTNSNNHNIKMWIGASAGLRF